MSSDRSIITGGRAVDWVTETSMPVARPELAHWADRQNAAQVVLAGVDHDHVGLRLLRTVREARDTVNPVGASEVLACAALLQAAVGQATLDGDETSAWAVIAADLLAVRDNGT